MKKSLSLRLMTAFGALWLWASPCQAAGATTPAPIAAPLPHVKHPGEAMRTKHVLLVETWRANYEKFIREHPDEFREHVRQVFFSYVVHPRAVRVEVAPTTLEQNLRGYFPRIVFEFRDGEFDEGRVRHLLVEMTDVQLNFEDLLLWDRVRFVQQGHIEYICEIGEDDLNKAIFESRERKKLNVKSARIELRDGSLRFSGRVPHSLGHTAVRVDGSMKVVNGTKIHFQPTGLKLSVLPLPAFVAREIFQRINPIADLDRLKMKATPDLIVSKPDRLYILTRGMARQIEKNTP